MNGRDAPRIQIGRKDIQEIGRPGLKTNRHYHLFHIPQIDVFGVISHVPPPAGIRPGGIDDREYLAAYLDQELKRRWPEEARQWIRDQGRAVDVPEGWEPPIGEYWR